MVVNRVFGNINNGEIDIISYSEEYFEGVAQVLNQSFFIYESVCIATEINKPESVQARNELTNLCKEVVKDGVSLLAREVATNRIVGVSINMLQHIDDKPSLFEKFYEQNVHSPNGKALMQLMIGSDKENDLFKDFDNDCIFEIMFLSTLPEYKGRRIGRTLSEYSVQLANELRLGKNVENLSEKCRHMRPKIVYGIFTSPFSQKIAKSLNFQTMVTSYYTEFSYNGKTFAERIGEGYNDTAVIMAKILE